MCPNPVFAMVQVAGKMNLRMSFRADGVGGVGVGGVEGLEEDRDDSDEERDGSGGDEYPRAQTDPVREAFQPLVHNEPGERHGEYERHQKRGAELRQEQGQNLVRCAAHNAAHSDLLAPLADEEQGHADEAQYGDQDGHASEYAYDPHRVLFLRERGLDGALDALHFPVNVFGRTVNLFDQVAQFLPRQRITVCLDHEVRILDLIRVLDRDHERLIRVKDVCHVKVGEHAGDLRHASVAPSHFGIPVLEGHFPRELLVDVFHISGEVVVLQKLDTHNVDEASVPGRQVG